MSRPAPALPSTTDRHDGRCGAPQRALGAVMGGSGTNPSLARAGESCLRAKFPVSTETNSGSAMMEFACSPALHVHEPLSSPLPSATTYGGCYTLPGVTKNVAIQTRDCATQRGRTSNWNVLVLGGGVRQSFDLGAAGDPSAVLLASCALSMPGTRRGLTKATVK